MMSEYRLPSIDIETVDKDKIYFNPGCALSVHNPGSEHKLLALLNEYFGEVKMHNRCCRHTPNLEVDSTIINNCAGCDRRFRSLYEGIQTISLWEVLASLDKWPLPKYPGLKVSIQDSCSYRPKPQVHAAVRILLKRMDIEIIEAKAHGTRSICCGDNFYPTIPIGEVNAFQQSRAAQMPCDDVVVYCISCIKSMAIGGKTPRHLVDLLLNQNTVVGETDLVLYHDSVQAYIDKSMTF